MTLTEQYNQILHEINTVKSRIQTTESKIADLQKEQSIGITERIENLQELLKKIDYYLPKVRAMQKQALLHLDSMNLPVVEAPEGYRVNIDQLAEWMMYIDPQSSNDPYAQRVYAVAKCDEVFLTKKKAEFETYISELEELRSSDSSIEIKKLLAKIDTDKETLRTYAYGTQVLDFSKEVVRENRKYWYEHVPDRFINAGSTNPMTALGAYALPFEFADEELNWLSEYFGTFLDVKGRRVLLPAEMPADKETIISVSCSASKSKLAELGIENYILGLAEHDIPGMRNVYLFDGERFNTSTVKALRKAEGSFMLRSIPRTPEKMTAALQEIVAKLADIDDIIGIYDSVREYNAENEGKEVPYTTIIFYGWPAAFSGDDKSLVEKIIRNYERYGISIVTVSYADRINNSGSSSLSLSEYALQNAVKINMTSRSSTITFPDSESTDFVWYTLGEELSDDYAEDVKAYKTEEHTVTTKYPDLFDCVSMPDYIRDYKKIIIPFGVNGKGEQFSASFEDENFAAYLVGASRSGKSTLIHTLIAGVLREYHPDNVELWLADFKQLEFKRYIDHLPPHVRYILLDESTELVYDIIDKLTDEMLDRQKLFARLGVQKINQVTPEMLRKQGRPLPVIFVILDEFSIMSQAIEDSPSYKLRLQNLLAKGAALGIKFLFSSQTFTSGVKGLTSTARAQIQQRIAMKGTRDEISETLELSANLKTEQVTNWIDALPPHYALVKHRISDDALPQVDRLQVMWFPDYAVRDELIQTIDGNMEAVQEYQPDNIGTYVDKHPVLVDGNSLSAFDEERFMQLVEETKKTESTAEGISLSFGVPRRMVDMKTATMYTESRENILLIARAYEQSCAASIVMSVIRSCRLQNKPVRIWAYSKNRLFLNFKDVFKAEGIEIAEGMDEVCTEIRRVRKEITEKVPGDEMIILLGMERICLDFELMEKTPEGSASKSDTKPAPKRDEEYEKTRAAAAVTTTEEEIKHKANIGWISLEEKLEKEAEDAGKSPEETTQYIKQKKKEYYEPVLAQIRALREKGDSAPEKPIADSKPEAQPAEPEKPQNENAEGAYNAANDFQYVIRQGSRFGHHFMLLVGDFSDVKACGLRADLFRYHLAFQLSVEDSRSMFNNRSASALPEHICQFNDSLDSYSFRPYLHKGIGWDGWSLNEDGSVFSPYIEDK